MNITRLVRLSLASVLGFSWLLLLSMSSVSAVGTKTWIGTDCNGLANDCNWSNSNNWSGGVIPADGDSIVFDNSSLNPARSPTNDINGLDVNSLSFINAGTGTNTIVLGSGLLGGDLTIDTAITQAASATTPNLIRGTMILGGDVTVTGNGANNLTLGSTSAGQANDILNLNGHALTFADAVNAVSSRSVTVTDVLSGNGTVNYNGAHTQFVLKGLNTYSGTTNVLASSTWIGGDVANQQPFGSSTVVVSTTAGIKFGYSTSTSIANTIRLSGSAANSGLPTSIYFANTGGSPVTFTVPHIVLLGNVRLSSDANTTVNLTGITDNGHCIEYLVNGVLSGTPFSGGPAICTTPSGGSTDSVATASTKVKPPNTGLAIATAHPLTTVITALAAALVLAYSLTGLRSARR